MSELGRYELLGEIGRGGMGSVFRARDPQLKRDVAIKIVRLEQSQDPEQRQHLVQRFETEAQAAARLNHPNIIAVYDFGADQGQAFLVMELAEGKNLADVLRDQRGRPLAVNQALRILRECAGALDHAHNMGVTHRDVKPANLIVLKGGGVKLTDFGIARIATMTGLTMAGQTLGTPHYMAPEAVDPSDDRPVGSRSDQFSLAVVAFELVTGQRPFEAESITALHFKILQAPPSTVELEPAAAAEELNRIFQRALAKDPADRYPSCRTMVVEIEAACRGMDTFPARATAASTPPPLSEEKETVLSAVRLGVADDSLMDRREDSFDPPSNQSPQMDSGRPGSWTQESGAQNATGTSQPEVGRTQPPPWKWIGGGIGAVALVAAGVWFVASPTIPPPTVEPQPSASIAPSGMVLVSAGDAVLGADRIPTQVAAFYMDRTEVTNEAWLKFCKEKARDCSAWAQVDASLPVVNVSFDEAAEYALWAGKRLPTWIEWEKAARGENGRTFPWGNEFRYEAVNLPRDRTGAQAAALVRADSFAAGASAFGTLNQLGNAWEWVASTTAPDEARFADLSRVFSNLSPPLSKTEPYYQIRGGSYRTAFPTGALPQLLVDWSPMPGRARRNDIGFRCVKDF